jgi:hyaluronan synthase
MLSGLTADGVCIDEPGRASTATTATELLDVRPWERPHEGALGRGVRWAAAATTAGLCALLIAHIVAKLQHNGVASFGSYYTLLVTAYVFSRFLLAAIYRPPRDRGLEPSVAIVVPAYNESVSVARTIHSCLGLDYPEERLEVVVINDGSSDDTWDHMQAAAAHYPAGRVRCVDLGSNQGKRAAMAEGIRRTDAEILVFVDSDSMPAPGAVRKLVQGFADSRVGSISGLTYVRNAESNTLTRMQAARYYVSFQLLKTGESVFGAVACCSGCFAAYRRAAVLPLLEQWEHQRFLGVECTYGDDRALTNMILRTGWRSIYDAEAEAWTDAPEQYRKFFKQQLRWKKSWAREGPILASHLWRSRPLAFPPVLVATISGLASPIVAIYNLVWQPLGHGVSPGFYLLCLYLMSMAYALMYRSLRSDGIWKFAVLATAFYVAFSFQLVWAIIRIRDGSWGTRPATPNEPDAPIADEESADDCARLAA